MDTLIELFYRPSFGFTVLVCLKVYYYFFPLRSLELNSQSKTVENKRGDIFSVYVIFLLLLSIVVYGMDLKHGGLNHLLAENFISRIMFLGLFGPFLAFPAIVRFKNETKWERVSFAISFAVFVFISILSIRWQSVAFEEASELDAGNGQYLFFWALGIICIFALFRLRHVRSKNEIGIL